MPVSKESKNNLAALLVALSLASTVVVGQATSQLAILTPPSMVLCTPVSIQWTNAADGPVYISLHPSNDPYGASIKDFPPIDASANSFTWKPDIATEQTQTLVLRIIDSKGQSNASGPIPLRASSDKSCLNGNSGSAPVVGNGAKQNTTTPQTTPSPSAAPSSPSSPTPNDAVTPPSSAPTDNGVANANATSSSSSPSKSAAPTHNGATPAYVPSVTTLAACAAFVGFLSSFF